MKAWIAGATAGVMALGTLAAAAGSAIAVPPVQAKPFPVCSWWTETTATTMNVAFPDTAATYWTTPFLAQPGMSIQVDGRYPQTRFMSFTVYDNAGGTFTLDNGVPSQIDDYEIDPDEGSLNPWQVSAPSGGEFTVTLSPDASPDDTNTLPILPSDPQPSGNLPANLGYLVMRVYLPQGGPSAVEMPVLTIVSSDGQESTLSACNKKTRPVAQKTKTGIKVMQALKRMASGGLPTPCGTNCPPSLSFFRASAATTNAFFPNTANAYASMLFTPTDDSVVVIRMRVPSSPSSVGGGTSPVPWPDDAYDLRYWSVCNNVYAKPYPVVANRNPRTGSTVYGCVADNAAVTTTVDGVEYATIVISSPADKPRNATKFNGYNWLPTSNAYPKAVEMVAVRNMLPSAGFSSAVQDVPQPATAAQAQDAMGTYYPETSSCSVAAFEAGGAAACFPNAG